MERDTTVLEAGTGDSPNPWSDDDDVHDQSLGLKICSFKAEGVPGLSIFVLVFRHPAVPEAGTGKPASVGGFYPFVPGDLTISFGTILYLLLCCSLLICSEIRWLYVSGNCTSCPSSLTSLDGKEVTAGPTANTVFLLPSTQSRQQPEFILELSKYTFLLSVH
jgi:hypothetical protein